MPLPRFMTLAERNAIIAALEAHDAATDRFTTLLARNEARAARARQWLHEWLMAGDTERARVAWEDGMALITAVEEAYNAMVAARDHADALLAAQGLKRIAQAG